MHLGEVGLGAGTEARDHGAEAVEHDVAVVARLLLEGVQDAVNEQLLQARVHVRRALAAARIAQGGKEGGGGRGRIYAPSVRTYRSPRNPCNGGSTEIIGQGRVSRESSCRDTFHNLLRGRLADWAHVSDWGAKSRTFLPCCLWNLESYLCACGTVPICRDRSPQTKQMH